MHEPRTNRRRTRGQALAEMGLVVVLLVTMLMGIIEFGRMLMLTNMVVHAARDGARIAAVTPTANGFGDAEQHVTDVLSEVGLGTMSVNAFETPDGGGPGVNTVTVTVSGQISYIFGFFGPLNVNRSVTFRHEA